MTTDQIVVVTYHCLCCGEIICQEEDLAVPSCCEQPMTEAVKETIDPTGESRPATDNDAADAVDASRDDVRQ